MKIKRRIPRFGPTLNEVDLLALEPQLRILEKSEIERETRKIKEEIEIINQRLTKEEEDTLIQGKISFSFTIQSAFLLFLT